jgi:hypothetical protein
MAGESVDVDVYYQGEGSGFGCSTDRLTLTQDNMQYALAVKATATGPVNYCNIRKVYAWPTESSSTLKAAEPLEEVLSVSGNSGAGWILVIRKGKDGKLLIQKEKGGKRSVNP